MSKNCSRPDQGQMHIVTLKEMRGLILVFWHDTVLYDLGKRMWLTITFKSVKNYGS